MTGSGTWVLLAKVYYLKLSASCLRVLLLYKLKKQTIFKYFKKKLFYL